MQVAWLASVQCHVQQDCIAKTQTPYLPPEFVQQKLQRTNHAVMPSYQAMVVLVDTLVIFHFPLGELVRSCLVVPSVQLAICFTLAVLAVIASMGFVPPVQRVMQDVVSAIACASLMAQTLVYVWVLN